MKGVYWHRLLSGLLICAMQVALTACAPEDEERAETEPSETATAEEAAIVPDETPQPVNIPEDLPAAALPASAPARPALPPSIQMETAGPALPADEMRSTTSTAHIQPAMRMNDRPTTRPDIRVK